MRIIARLDIKNDILVKAIMFDGVKKLGNPEIFAEKYYKEGIDELMIVNNTGSLYNTRLNPILLEKIRVNKPIPISAGGGISNYDDAMKLIESGCDKVVINSLIHKDIKEVKKIVNTIGAASVTGAIQYEKKNDNNLVYQKSKENDIFWKSCFNADYICVNHEDNISFRVVGRKIFIKKDLPLN